MNTTNYTIKHWDWVTVWGRYLLPYELGILILFKRSMFALGFEFLKHGLMIFVGPFAIGIGTVKEQPNE
jgi:hypothetical protein